MWKSLTKNYALKSTETCIRVFPYSYIHDMYVMYQNKLGVLKIIQDKMLFYTTAHVLPVTLDDIVLIFIDNYNSQKHIFPNENNVTKHQCFEREMEYMRKYNPDVQTPQNMIYVLRGAIGVTGSNSIALSLVSICYLADAQLAIRRFQLGPYVAKAKQTKYSGFFLEGLCRIGSNKGVGKYLVNMAIRIANLERKELYLSVFNVIDDVGVNNSHGRLLAYYESFGFKYVNEYTSSPITYTIMRLDTS